MLEKSHQIKRYVAEHSPKSYARRIRMRNELLLKALLVIDLDEPDSDITHVNWGCPHCSTPQICSRCLWDEAATHFENWHELTCVDVAFGGTCLGDISIHGFVGVTYSPGSACVERYDRSIVTDDERRQANEELASCKAFLQAHIAWSKWKCWGTKYKVQ